MVTDKGGSGETEGDAGACRLRTHVSAAWAKDQATVRVCPGLVCLPGRRSAPQPARALLPPSPKQTLAVVGRPVVAVVVVALRAGSSGPKHFTIALQNC